jgi:hypothetical protein
MTPDREIGLETIEGIEGRVILGWVGARVFYARFVGTLSCELSLAFIVKLQQISRDRGTFLYFSDARALLAYDIGGKRAFLDFVVERRHQLESCVSLTWAEGESASSRVFAARVGQAFEVLTDEVEFEERLFAVAPLAQHLLAEISDGSMTTPAASPLAKVLERPLLRPLVGPGSIEAPDKRVLDDAERILKDVFIWLESYEMYRCEVEPALNEPAANQVWDAVLNMARLVGLRATRQGTSILVSRTRPRNRLH